MLRKVLLSLASLAFTQTVFAESLAEKQLIAKGELHASVSIGYGGIQNPVLNSDNFTTPILPNLTYYGERWFFDNFAVGYSLVEQSNFYVDISGRFNEDGFFFELDGIDKLFAAGVVSGGLKDTPSRPEDGLTPIERDLSYLAGLSTGYKLSDSVLLEASLMQDVTGVHDGHEGQLNIFKVFNVDDALFGLELGATYKNRELISYYYTLAAREALVRIPSYDNKSALNYHFKLSYEYPLSERFSVDVNVKHTWLDSDLVNNPMISETGYFSGFAGITYHF
ncbi:MipA/OmpV family protein [Pseudoalteromonas shioyasakiensis]|uniref:MipA/OmpV family protein n=1 Tax=Pseudoalteromonas shioyasakiensis TaxID=1190813 RepID=UPI0021172D8A|nr:MipA/OmpV family protein [Pseudoalteromonas shioyasakiensis]MCQ8879034.1 MipA/OmpV family protein [Pseudoalteromonas shioyasakiensis]